MTDNKLNFDQKNSLKSNELQILICHFYFQYMRVETKQNRLMWIITALCISLIIFNLGYVLPAARRPSVI